MAHGGRGHRRPPPAPAETSRSPASPCPARGRSRLWTCTWPGLLLRQMLAEESKNLAPAVHRLLGPVERPVPVEDAVARAVIAVDLVALAVVFELGFVLVHLLGTWRAVVVAEDADQRAREVLRQVD